MSSKGRTAVEVTDRREIARIAKACKANGGPWSFENVETEGDFNLRCVKGMTAWRVNQNWLKLTGKAPKAAAKPKAPAKVKKPAVKAPTKGPATKVTAKVQKPVAKAPAKAAEKTPTAPAKVQSAFDRIQAEKLNGILAVSETPDKAEHISVADARRRGDKPKAGYEDAEEDDPEIDEDEVPDEEPEEPEEEEPSDKDLDEEEEKEEDLEEEKEDIQGELRGMGLRW